MLANLSSVPIIANQDGKNAPNENGVKCQYLCGSLENSKARINDEGKLSELVGDGNSHLYVVREEGRIVWCACLCVAHSPEFTLGFVKYEANCYVWEVRIRPDRVVLTLGLEEVAGDSNPTSTDINRYERMVLEEVVEESKHIEQLMKVCDYKDRDSFRKSVLNGMLERGLVEMTHPENVRHKEQRYVITDLGRYFLDME